MKDPTQVLEEIRAARTQIADALQSIASHEALAASAQTQALQTLRDASTIFGFEVTSLEKFDEAYAALVARAEELTAEVLGKVAEVNAAMSANTV